MHLPLAGASNEFAICIDDPASGRPSSFIGDPSSSHWSVPSSARLSGVVLLMLTDFQSGLKWAERLYWSSRNRVVVIRKGPLLFSTNRPGCPVPAWPALAPNQAYADVCRAGKLQAIAGSFLPPKAPQPQINRAESPVLSYPSTVPQLFQERDPVSGLLRPKVSYRRVLFAGHFEVCQCLCHRSTYRG